MAVSTFEIIRGGSQHFRHFRSELESLTRQLDCLNVQLLLLQRFQETVAINDLLLSEVEIRNPESCLQVSISSFSEIQKFFAKQALKSSKRAQIRWALVRASEAKNWEHRLQRQSNGVMNIPHLLQL